MEFFFCNFLIVVLNKEFFCLNSSFDEVIVSEIFFKCGLFFLFINVVFFFKIIFIYNVFFYLFDVGDVFIIFRK